MFEKLTPQQRKHYYEQALLHFRTANTGPFLCNVLYWLLMEDMIIEPCQVDVSEVIRINLPEIHKEITSALVKAKPGGYANVAWKTDIKGNNEREAALRRCIDDVNSIIKSQPYSNG